jgi:hypothetical protein
MLVGNVGMLSKVYNLTGPPEYLFSAWIQINQLEIKSRGKSGEEALIILCQAFNALNFYFGISPCGLGLEIFNRGNFNLLL